MYMMLTLIDIKYVKYIYHYFKIEITNSLFASSISNNNTYNTYKLINNYSLIFIQAFVNIRIII